MKALAPTLLSATLAASAAGAFTFENIDGGTHDLTAWSGQPILVVNTASQCGFTPQYEGLQALQDRYAKAGLVVLAVPSDDFNQELDSASEVKEFCEVTYGLTLPMAEITPVRGRNAHPFYAWVREETGFEPRWNFNKVLIGSDGEISAVYGSTVRPLSRKITGEIEAELAAMR